MFENYSILYVDDNALTLKVFQDTFSKHYKVFTAITQSDALETLNKNEIHVIISDQIMPEGLGTDFLLNISELYPGIVRMLMTAHQDADTLVNAVNKGKVYYFLNKPWNKDYMLRVFENAFTYYSLQKTNRKLRDSLKNAYSTLKGSQDILQKLDNKQIIGSNKIVYLGHKLNDSFAKQLSLAPQFEVDFTHDSQKAMRSIIATKAKIVICCLELTKPMIDFFETLNSVNRGMTKIVISKDQIDGELLLSAINKGKVNHFLKYDKIKSGIVQEIENIIHDKSKSLIIN